jgi:ATP-dependent helicase/nuclease subunit A
MSSTYEVKGQDNIASPNLKLISTSFSVPLWCTALDGYVDVYQETTNNDEACLEQNLQSFTRGKIIHELLEYIAYFSQDDFKIKAQEFLTTKGLCNDDSQIILEKINTLLKYPTLAKIFSNQALIEVPIYARDEQGKLRLRRLDRLLVEENKIYILDYKTNRLPPKNSEGIPQAYVKQMKEYKEILAKIYPQAQITGILLFIESMTYFEI